jgi:methionyl-tRNA synthetase
MKSFYITTAIDYPNGRPHMGHAYEKIVTDVYARWYRRLGVETRFLTGTDENGQKLVKSAEAVRQGVQAYVDENVLHFKELCERLQISNDDFIRTTEQRHHQVASELWSRIEKNGDLYEGEYEGQYCIACEAFYTETQSPQGLCPSHGTSLQKIKEKGYFFRLSKYVDWIEQHIQSHPHFINPERSRKEMLQRLRAEPVRDLSVSRPNTGWGIPIPGHPQYVMYTWFDALINYLTAVRSEPLYSKFWPASCHVIGKDITWFHAIIWPCMLKAADIAPPDQIYVHGMVLGEDGRKMSKSLGNGVDPIEVLNLFPLDSFRYYLLRAIPSGSDGAFVTADLKARHNSELANDLGNLLSRVVKLAAKKLEQSLEVDIRCCPGDVVKLREEMSKAMDRREHHLALELLWKFIGELNLFITRREPWKLEAQSTELREVLGGALVGILAVAQLLEPFMPLSSDKILKSLGIEATSGMNVGEKSSFRLQDPEMLFPKMQ